jgi:hypothetical protein
MKERILFRKGRPFLGDDLLPGMELAAAAD